MSWPASSVSPEHGDGARSRAAFGALNKRPPARGAAQVLRPRGRTTSGLQSAEEERMAKSPLDNDLFKRLRDSGMRKRVARAIAEAGENSPKLVRGTVDELRGLADELESKVRGSSSSKSRSAAAKKGAATRKRTAAKRSTAAKKGAATRARKSGSSSSSRSSGSSSRSSASSSRSSGSG